MTAKEKDPSREVDSPFTTRELLLRIDYLMRTLERVANPRVPNTIGPLNTFTELDLPFISNMASEAMKRDSEVKESKGLYGPELP